MGSILSTRLHACTAQRKFDKALKLVNQERASKVDKLGNLPLHIACITGAPIGLIESLVAVSETMLSSSCFLGPSSRLGPTW